MLFGSISLMGLAGPADAQVLGRWARPPETASGGRPVPPPLVEAVIAATPAEAVGEVAIPSLSDRWKMAAELSLTDQSGNRVLRLLTGGLRVSHREKEAFELDGSIQSRYGMSEGETVARNHYLSLSFGLHPEDTWSPFLYFTAERDPFKRLDLRFSGGAGAKLRPFDIAPSDEVSMSLALLYSSENLRPSESDPNPLDRDVGRWSLRVHAAHVVSETLRVQQVATYEPVWDHMADYLLRSETGARVHLTERLALSVTYALDRTARPPEGVRPDDRLLKTGLIIDF